MSSIVAGELTAQTATVTCTNKCGGSVLSETLSFTQTAKQCRLSATMALRALDHTTVALPISAEPQVVIYNFRRFFFNWVDASVCTDAELKLEKMTVGEKTTSGHFAIKGENIVTTVTSDWSTGVTVALGYEFGIIYPGSGSTTTTSTFYVTQSCNQVSAKASVSTYLTVSYGGAAIAD